jgi:hypothetical protein
MNSFARSVGRSLAMLAHPTLAWRTGNRVRLILTACIVIGLAGVWLGIQQPPVPPAVPVPAAATIPAATIPAPSVPPRPAVPAPSSRTSIIAGALTLTNQSCQIRLLKTSLSSLQRFDFCQAEAMKACVQAYGKSACDAAAKAEK